MMKMTLATLLTAVALTCVAAVDARSQAAGETGAKTEVSTKEVTAKVPELDDLHEVVYQLWHDAFPAKDCKLIRDLLPQTDELVAKLDAAALPGILRDKQGAWDAGKAKLKESLAALHAAADANDEDAMLKQTEVFHAEFEGLVRVIRPVVPALEAFHQELYKLYHYYAPDYDLANIRTASAAMQERIPPLKESTLPKRVADRRKDFDAAVAKLSSAVDELVKTGKKDDREKILAAVEKVHSAYVKTVGIFE